MTLRSQLARALALLCTNLLAFRTTAARQRVASAWTAVGPTARAIPTTPPASTRRNRMTASCGGRFQRTARLRHHSGAGEASQSLEKYGSDHVERLRMTPRAAIGPSPRSLLGQVQ